MRVHSGMHTRQSSKAAAEILTLTVVEARRYCATAFFLNRYLRDLFRKSSDQIAFVTHKLAARLCKVLTFKFLSSPWPRFPISRSRHTFWLRASGMIKCSRFFPRLHEPPLPSRSSLGIKPIDKNQIKSDKNAAPPPLWGDSPV